MERADLVAAAPGPLRAAAPGRAIPWARRPTGAVALGAAAALLASSLGLAACTTGDARSAPPTRVLLVSIDTLRADALGSYGNPAGASPALDALAAAGLRAATCIAPSPLTFPSHATLLTGLHPLEHGVVGNSQGALAPGVSTLAERLAARGWWTGAIVSSGILRARYGLDQGFAHYRDDLFSRAPSATGSHSLAEAPADATTDAAIEWLGTLRDEQRALLFLHYIDPHAPYDPPPPHRGRFADAPYLGEVAFVDAEIARLLAWLAARGWREDTLLVITSDHGESLGAHGLATHGQFLYEEVLRVPLILNGPGLEAGRVIEEPTGLVDVVPTLLDLLGLWEPPDASLAGRSLLAPIERERAFVAVSYDQALLYGWSPLWAWWSPREKLIRAPRSEYFRLDVDPGEQEDRSQAEPERVSALTARLDERARGYLAHTHTARALPIDESTRSQLAALGYAARDGLAQDARALDDFSGPDPKSMRAARAALDAYLTARFTGRLDEAGEQLSRARALDPDNPFLVQEEGLLLLLSKRDADFVRWLDAQPEALRAQPAQRARRALASWRLGRAEDAEAQLRAILAEHPSHSESLHVLARLQAADGRGTEALATYATLLDHEPRDDEARYARARLLIELGQVDRARAELEQHVALAPRFAPARRSLGLLLAGQDPSDPHAIEQLDTYLRLDPEAADRLRIERVIIALRTGQPLGSLAP